MITLKGVLAAILFYLFLSHFRQAFKPLPPGPRALPVIGNLHQLPKQAWWKIFQKWHGKYGPIITLKFGGRIAILLGTQAVAKDLLDKRGRIYSSRPRMVMAAEIMTKGDHMIMLPYGPKWRNHHRIHGSLLNVRAIQNYRVLQHLESLQVMIELLSTDNYAKCFSRFQASLINTLAYGTRIADADEPQLKESEEISKAFIEAVTTGDWLVDSFPILNRLPSCLAPWKRFGDRIHAQIVRLLGAKTIAALKTGSWNWVKHVRTLKETENMSEHELLFLIGVLYEAGVDIVASNLRLFVMASVLHPVAIQSAQEELDSVVGSDRLPTFHDMANLPYVRGFVKEVLRWRPLTFMGAAHAVTEEDHYMGYTIPKGAMVFPNQWTMDMDEAVFEDAESFRPERWIKSPTLTVSVFGFGRRSCAGQHLALESLFIIISRLLWAYDFDHVYENGKRIEIDPWGFVQEASVLVAKPFRASLRIRDQCRHDIIRTAWLSAEKDADRIMEQVGRGFS